MKVFSRIFSQRIARIPAEASLWLASSPFTLNRHCVMRIHMFCARQKRCARSHDCVTPIVKFTTDARKCLLIYFIRAGTLLRHFVCISFHCKPSTVLTTVLTYKQPTCSRTLPPQGVLRFLRGGRVRLHRTVKQYLCRMTHGHNRMSKPLLFFLNLCRYFRDSCTYAISANWPKTE